MRYGTINIKKYLTVIYLGCSLDENLSGESMAQKVINKMNSKFLCRNNRFLFQPIGRLLCNSLIQPHFDYVCSTWNTNMNKRFKWKLKTLQNKCSYFYLNLNNGAHIGLNQFEKPIGYHKWSRRRMNQVNDFWIFQ